jgi:hypothetical protein
MSCSYRFSKQEKSVRKHWLVSTVVCFGLQALVNFLIFSFVAFVFLAEGAVLSTCYYTAIAYVGICALSLTPFYLLYRCAYQKCGTGVLTFFLIFEAVLLLFSLIQVVRGESDTKINMIAFGSALSIWWGVLSLKLRKLNKKISIEA